MNLNFSLWLDFLSKDFLQNGFAKLVDSGKIRGATTNPAIFASSFKSPSYRDDILKLKSMGKNTSEIYEDLAINDIQKAADLLKNVFIESNKMDGFVSLEVDPNLCDDSEATIKEALRLHQRCSRENIMIKIPTTKAGINAMKILSDDGININATLLFAPHMAQNAFESLSHKTNNVLSVFVSRIDRYLAPILSQNGVANDFIGIFNACLIYHNLNLQNNTKTRMLFASTGVKGDVLPKDFYIKNLIYKNTINTAPLETCKAYFENDKLFIPSPAIDVYKIKELFDMVGDYVDIDAMYLALLTDGLESFKQCFVDIKKTIEEV